MLWIFYEYIFGMILKWVCNGNKQQQNDNFIIYLFLSTNVKICFPPAITGNKINQDRNTYMFTYNDTNNQTNVICLQNKRGVTLLIVIHLLKLLSS